MPDALPSRAAVASRAAHGRPTSTVINSTVYTQRSAVGRGRGAMAGRSITMPRGYGPAATDRRKDRHIDVHPVASCTVDCWARPRLEPNPRDTPFSSSYTRSIHSLWTVRRCPFCDDTIKGDSGVGASAPARLYRSCGSGSVPSPVRAAAVGSSMRASSTGLNVFARSSSISSKESSPSKVTAGARRPRHQPSETGWLKAPNWPTGMPWRIPSAPLGQLGTRRPAEYDDEPHFREAASERLLVHDLAAAPDPARCAHVWPDDLTEAQCLHCNLDYEFWTTCRRRLKTDPLWTGEN